MIYFTSDWHFNHNQPFIWDARDFSSVEEMNEEIVRRHNSVITEDDEVYVLGDLCMGPDLAANKELIERLNGKLHIVFGNHDTDKRKEMYSKCKNVVEICGYATVIKYKKYHFYLSHYPTATDNYNDQGLKNMVINLCGHIHTTRECLELDNGIVSYHVEVDAHNCYPVSAEEALAALRHYYADF